jgi:hypothetical protein
MERTWPETASLLGVVRPSITVRLDPNAGNSSYSPSADEITIRSTGDADHVWGPLGIFVAAHEYGHAVHERALGGNVAGGQCPSPHYIDGAHNLQCAYSEGFANFHAVATRRADLRNEGESDWAIEQNFNYPGWVYEHGSPVSPSTDGSIIEGAVAAFLYDLVDAPDWPDSPFNTADGDDDSVTFPGSYLADIIRTCNVLYSSWTRADGIDHLIYCLEQQVDPAVTGSQMYFPTRSSDPFNQTEAAAEPPGWSVAVIRALWTRNLYGQYASSASR